MMLSVESLHAYYGPVEAVGGVDLQVEQGEFVTIVGANGAGKSTLLSAIAGLLSTRTGRVVIDGHELPPGRPEKAVELGLVLVAEEREVFGPLNVEENLLLGAYLRGGRGREVRADLDRVYNLFPVLAEKRQAPAATLSGGQQQMLALGRGLMSRPRLLLLDEPSLGLAPLIVKEIFATISVLRGEGLTVLLVEQNANLALSLSDRGYVMENGSMLLSGLSRDLAADRRVREAYLGGAERVINEAARG